MRHQNGSRYLILVVVATMVGFSLARGVRADPLQDNVSYFRDVLPILKSNCHGCHQPAKAEGSYCMTSFTGLLAGGESQQAAIQPGQPADSQLLALITPLDGEAEMPLGNPPLSAVETDLIKRWIEQGAENDAAAGPSPPDKDHPPIYRAAPVVTSLDVSPDGQLLAVAGYYEVLLCDVASEKTIARLIGLSKRVQSVKFSPDGQRLAVTGGTPALAGEVQIWDVARRQLMWSLPVTYDTVYGASWSPDGKLVAFGCSDNSVRAIDAETGQQVLFQASHNDWVLDTTFSKDGTHLVSVSRDRTAKLILVAEERFVDNITSITPGALKGGISAVERHPEHDQLLIGGADGTPVILRMQRITARQIGDNANLIRRFPSVTGRIFDVAYAPDGKRIAVASSLDGHGQVDIYGADFDATVNEELTQLFAKKVDQRSPSERQQIDAYQTADVPHLATVDCGDSVYALAFCRNLIMAAGSDGYVRTIDPVAGSIVSQFLPFRFSASPASVAAPAGPWKPTDPEPAAIDDTAKSSEQLPEIVRLSIEPTSISIRNQFDYVQCLVTAQTAAGELLDVTRDVQWTVPDCIAAGENGLLTPRQSGAGHLLCSLGSHTTIADIRVQMDDDTIVDFVRDVTPVMSRLGCNAGTCHGAKDGKQGFKLSLRGYDPLFDVRALTDDLASRRVNLAAAEQSLMLLKATGSVPHTGSQLTIPGQRYYEILRQWVAAGARLNPESSRVSSIQLFPRTATVARPGVGQQFRVLATYPDGSERDVTAEAFITSGNTEVAETDGAGLLQAVRRGEAPVLARYAGAYDAALLTVMGDRSGFQWVDVPVHNFIDDLVYKKLKRIKALPSELCTDAEFLRRASLDLTGLPPTLEQVTAFLADETETRAKRNAVIDQLVGSEPFIEYWTNKWADLLQVNRKFLGAEGATAFRQWLRDQVAANRPYNEFAKAILTVTGSNREHPQAAYFKSLRTPEDLMENTTHLFLGIRFNCNKCHDHPFERWTQDQYYALAAYFARVERHKDEESGKRTVGGTAVEGATPLYEIISDADEGEVKHERTGADTVPRFPYESPYSCESLSRREHLAAWITSPDNPYFAKSYVNRLWGYLFGVGIIEPIDDLRAGNPPTNPELLEELTRRFIDSGFDVRETFRTICRSRVYQLASRTHRWNEDDLTNYSHALPRRLPAEVLYDAIHLAAGAKSTLPNMAGRRAVELPDSGVKLPSGLLDQLGRPARESACECERVNSMQLGPVMALVTGPDVNAAIHDSENAIAELVKAESDNDQLIRRLYLRFLNREATDDEVARVRDVFAAIPAEHQLLLDELATAELEFAPSIKKLKADREAAIKVAQAALTADTPEAAKRQVVLAKQRADSIAAAQQKLKEFTTHWLQTGLPELEKEAASLIQWIPLTFDELTSENHCQLKQLDDKSILASGPHGATAYRLKALAPSGRLTGIRLEALTDASLKNNGPGRSPASGNFVVNEFRAFAVSNFDTSLRTPITLQNALADYSQPGYDVKTAIDGKVESTLDGWAIEGGNGQDHFAVFEVDQARVIGPGAHLEIAIVQHYADGQHSLGRFRILITSERQPLSLDGIHANAVDALAKSADRRSADEMETIQRFARSRDPVWTKLFAEVQLRQAMPVPPDEQQTVLDNALELAQRPIRLPAQLVRLRSEVELSQQQVSRPRLTAAQDLAWALINSSAFIFNH